MSKTTPLARKISFLQLFFYGLGTIIGAGFYALLGKIAGEAGYFAPFSFLLAGVIAFFTALSYCELSSRYPYSGGEAYYVNEAYKRPWFTSMIGWMVIATGLVSAATLTSAISGFVEDLTDIPRILNLILCICFLGGLAIWGIGKSTIYIVGITCLEVGLLLFILWDTQDTLFIALGNITDFIPPFEATIMTGVMGGAFLAFYAFIGFEDMVNLSEEVKNVRDFMPKAIILSLLIATILYVLVSIAALSLVTPDMLSASNTPLALVMHRWGAMSTTGIGLISILAASNGALVQIIMAARVVYGLAHTGNAAPWFKDVHTKTQTPIKATLFMMILILILALLFPLLTLAKVASGVLLFVFLWVNLSLIHIKMKPTGHQVPGTVRTYPLWIPFVGALSSGLILLYNIAIQII